MPILLLLALLLLTHSASSSIAFHQNGHLYQIDHAKLAVKKGSTIVSAKCSDGVLLLVISNEKRTVLQMPTEPKHKITKSLYMVATGYSFDATALLNTVRAVATDYRSTFSEDISVQYLCEVLAKPIHDRTKKSGRRLMATEAVFVECDCFQGRWTDNPTTKYKIFKIDVDGSFRGYKSLCIGGKYSNDIMEKMSEIESAVPLETLTVQTVLKSISPLILDIFNGGVGKNDIFTLRESFDVKCYKGSADQSTGILHWDEIEKTP